MAAIAICFAVFMWFCVCPLTFRIIVFEAGKVHVKKDIALFSTLQYRVDEQISNIEAISFDFEMNIDSHGKTIGWNMRQSFNPISGTHIKMFMKDGRLERIMLTGFTEKQCRNIQRTFLECNPNMIIKNDVENFIKTYKKII